LTDAAHNPTPATPPPSSGDASYYVPPVAESAALLQPLTTALLECTAPADVVEVVVERGMRVLGAHAGLVALITRDGQEFEIVRTSGYAPSTIEKWTRFPVDGPFPLSDVVRIGEPLFLKDRTDWAAKYPRLSGDITDSYQASVSLPLSARQRVFGAMHFSFLEARTFTDADRAFLDELSRQCALALERALLLAEVEAARTRLEFLSQASMLLAQSLDYQTTLDAIAHLAVPALCDWVTVDLLDDAEDDNPTGGEQPDKERTLRLAVAAHVDPAEVRFLHELREHSPIDMTQTGQPPVIAIQTGETVFLPEITPEMVAAAAPGEERRRFLERLDLRSLVSVPLRTTRGVNIGAITLVSTGASGRMFTPDTVSLAEELTRRAAVAVDNARLFERTRREIAERAEAERQAERVAADLRLITDAAPLLISYVSADQRYRFANAHYADWFGLRPEQIVGRPVREIIGEAAFAKIRYKIEAALAGETVSYEDMLPYAEGEQPRYIHAEMVPDRGADGTIHGYVAVIMDITARVEGERALREAARTQRRFLQEMLAGFTEGRLRLCFAASELPAPLPPLSASVALSPDRLRLVRQMVKAAAVELMLPEPRAADFETAVHEGAVNAVKYGGGGTARIHGDSSSGILQVWIVDQGPGIAEDLIHRAVERGYTTAGFGHGMFFMQSCTDRLYLLTGPTGTTVVLEIERIAPEPVWLRT
jgi:PAS domain S-box-containing protein